MVGSAYTLALPITSCDQSSLPTYLKPGVFFFVKGELDSYSLFP